MRLTKVFKAFFESEKSAGFILIVVSVVSLLLANSAIKNEYINFWNWHLGEHSITHWINDGLMTVFFLLIGLELEREIYIGELRNIKNAALPIIAALGGMLIPASMYSIFNFGTPSQSGAGIPMATDIAFAIGVLSLLGNRVPTALKVFLTALAVIDDLGAILVIALFYTSELNWINLFISLGIFGTLLLLNKNKVNHFVPYIIGGVLMWYFMSISGVHATITGVLLAFAIPFRRGNKTSPSYQTQNFLHSPVAYFILPLFAIANTCIPLSENWVDGLMDINSVGIILGLFLGKPLGILLFSIIGVTLGLAVLPKQLRWRNIIGAGFLGGIGFTMSIFITLLAFEESYLINSSKIAIIVGSLLSAVLGLLILRFSLKIKSI